MFYRHMRTIGIGIALATIAAPGHTEQKIVGDIGLNGSEAARYDAKGDRWLVSNLGTRGAGNDGYISEISPDGGVINSKWIVGGSQGVALFDPLGLIVHEDTIYVADTDTVRSFDRETGKPAGDYKVPGAVRLNDLAVDKAGTIYVTDSGSDDNAGAIYKISKGKVTAFAARDPALERPNGIAVMADGNIVHGGRGVNLVVRTPQGKIVREITLPTGRMDGIVPLPDNSLLVASQDGHVVYKVPAIGKPSIVAKDIPIPAAIGLDTKRNIMVVPQIVAGNLTFVDLQ